MSKTITIRNYTVDDKQSAIVIPLVGATKERIISEALYVCAIEAKMVEWRIDYFEQNQDVSAVLEVMEEIKNILDDHVIMATVRTSAQGGLYEGTISQYVNLYNALIKQGIVDLIDVECVLEETKVKSLIEEAHKHNKYVVLSYHDFEKTCSEDELKAIYKNMESFNGDILKTAMMATTEDEVRDYMHAAYHIQKESDKLCAFMNMGKEGIISRLFCAYTKSCLSFASMRQASAPGQVSFVNMNDFMKMCNKILEA